VGKWFDNLSIDTMIMQGDCLALLSTRKYLKINKCVTLLATPKSNADSLSSSAIQSHTTDQISSLLTFSIQNPIVLFSEPTQ
jgi:hypothetical protein